MKFIIKIFFIIFFLFYLQTKLYSQTVKTRHYTVEDGLPSSEVYHVFQDSKGYIWFATNYGVSRFDGYNFTNYSNNDGLPDNTVLETYEDPTGKIWFISMNCKLAYWNNTKITPFLHNDEILKHLKDAPYYVRGGFRIDAENNIYLNISKHGIFKISPDHIITNEYADLNKYKPDAYLNVIENNRTEFVINAAYSTEIINLEKVKVSWRNHQFYFDFLEKKLSSALRYSLITKQKKLLFSYSNHLVEISENEVSKTHKFEKGVITINNDYKDNVWVGFYKGGIMCFKNGNLNKKPILHLLKDLSVSGFIRDKEGGIWLTTIEKGIYYIPSDLLYSYTTQEGLSEDNISSIIFDGKNIFALAEKLNKICIDSSCAIISNKPESKLTVLRNLFYDPYREKTWLSANFAFYSVISNKSSLQFKQELSNQDSKVWSINGVVINKDSICFSNVNHILIEKNGIVNQFKKPVNSLLKIISIASDNQGCIYVGSYNGLWKFQNSGFSYLGNIDPILKNRINVVQWNKTLNALVLGTKGLGLLLLKDNKVFQIDKTKGITGSLITSMQMNNTDVWVGTDNGINKISFDKNNIKNFSITTITTKNGLISNEVNSLFLYHDLLFAGTNGGVTYFNTKSFAKNLIPPPVYFTDFSVMGRDTIIKEKIELPYDKNDITISYVGLSFKDAGNLEYKYKLEGTDRNWKTTRLTHIQYSKLSPGDYNFSVYASNENGIWSTKPAAIRFIIHPAFWQTLWFRILFILFIIGIISLIYLNRLKNIKERNKLSQKANKYMLLSMGKQLNPHFIFNSLNAIQGFIFKNDKQSSNEYISDFALLMRKTLYNSQSDFIPLADEIELLSTYIKLECMRFNDKFTYEINTDPQLDISHWKIPPFILQPYVENAIIHGLRHKENFGHLLLNWIYKDNNIFCVLEDNGIGREQSGIINKENRKGHISMGSQITDHRINLINSLHNFNISMNYFDLHNEEGLASGTRVEFVFPVIF